MYGRIDTAEGGVPLHTAVMQALQLLLYSMLFRVCAQVSASHQTSADDCLAYACTKRDPTSAGRTLYTNPNIAIKFL